MIVYLNRSLLKGIWARRRRWHGVRLGGRRMWGAYEDWQHLLAAEFFGPEAAGQPVTMYVTLDSAERLRQEHGLPCGLVDAVSAQMSWDRLDRVFGHIVSDCEKWAKQPKSRGQGPPPSLPVLASSVMAAARMAAGDGMASSNFYGRWTQLFGTDRESERGRALLQRFEDVVWMWQQLDEWLEEQEGRFGFSTISSDRWYWRIGYPLSQALLRTSDREALTRFFAATGLLPGNPAGISGRELAWRLRLWSTGRDRRLSPRLLEEIRQERPAGKAADTMLATLLERMARQWDGLLHEAGRQRRRKALPLRLLLVDKGRQAEWHAAPVPGVERTRVGFPEGRQFDLVREYGYYSGLEGLAPTAQRVQGGLHLAGEDLHLEWPGDEVVLLREDEDLGEWLSTETFTPGLTHWLLASPGAESDVRRMLSGVGADTVREASGPFPGWKIFKNVKEVDPAAFQRSLTGGGAHLHMIEPPVRDQASLVGGLRIVREFRGGQGVAGHYLQGGEPDLLLPSPRDDGDGMVPVVLNGVEQRLRRDVRIPFPLRALGLDEGDYSVGTADSTMTFTVSSGVVEHTAPGTGTLEHVPGQVGFKVVPASAGVGAVRGACSPGNERAHGGTVSTALLYGLAAAYFLGADGQVWEAPVRSAPAWIADRPDAAAVQGLTYQLPVPSEAFWLLTFAQPLERSRGPVSADRLPQEGARVYSLVSYRDIPAPDPEWEDEEWALAVLQAAGARGMTPQWAEYVAAARSIWDARGGR